MSYGFNKLDYDPNSANNNKVYEQPSWWNTNKGKIGLGESFIDTLQRDVNAPTNLNMGDNYYAPSGEWTPEAISQAAIDSGQYNTSELQNIYDTQGGTDSVSAGSGGFMDMMGSDGMKTSASAALGLGQLALGYQSFREGKKENERNATMNALNFQAMEDQLYAKDADGNFLTGADGRKVTQATASRNSLQAGFGG